MNNIIKDNLFKKEFENCIIHKNQDFYCAISCISVCIDFEQSYYLDLDCDDESLGQAVLLSLKNKRQLETWDEFYDLESNLLKNNYEEWIEFVQQKYGYKTKKKMFAQMDMVSVSTSDDADMISIHPTNHERLEAWGGTGIDKKDKIYLPKTANAEEIGAAVKLAFSRCI